MSTMTMEIDTAKVTGRREIRFASFADISADVEMLAQAKEIRSLGNWSPGQICKHLSLVMNSSIDGFPRKLPWVVRLICRLFIKQKLLNGHMKAGFKLPKEAADILPPPTSLQDGLLCIRSALRRLETESTRVASPFLGPMTYEDWTKLHCRHSELHLSFLIPVS